MNIDTKKITDTLKTRTTINNDTAEKLLAKLNEEVLELGIEMLDEQCIFALRQELADVVIVLSQIVEYYNMSECEVNDKLLEVESRYGKHE